MARGLRGVRDDLSELGRHLLDIACFLHPLLNPAHTDSPPPTPTGPAPRRRARRSPSPHPPSPSLLAGILSDLAEIGGSFRGGFSRAAAAPSSPPPPDRPAPAALESQQAAASPPSPAAAAPIVDDVVGAARALAARPEAWIDFPVLALDEDSVISDIQRDHMESIEKLVPDLASLRGRLCPSYMDEDIFWKIYFRLLESNIIEHSSEEQAAENYWRDLEPSDIIEESVNLELPAMENNSQPPAPAAPAAKVTPPANETPKTTQPSSNLEVVPVASRTPAMDGSSAQPQRGTAVVSVPLRSVQQHPQPLSLQVLALAGTGTGSMFGPTAQCGATMPRSPTAVGSLACRPVQQTNPVVFGQGSSSSNQAMQGSSSTQAVAMTALAAATHGPTAQHGAAVPGWLPRAALLPSYRVVRPTKLMVKKLPAPPPPKLPVYRPPPPPRPELPNSSAAGNALLPSSSDTGFCVLNLQADPPSPDQVTMAEEGSDSEGGGGSGDDVQMLDLNFPPVSNNEEN